MIIKNHKIVLKDTNPGEMARFRHFFLNIWSQQIEDDKNTAEIEKFAAKYTNNTTRLGEITIKNDLYGTKYVNDTNKIDKISLKNDLWQKSGNNTKWNNNNDGTFSSDNKSAEYQEDEKCKATELRGNYSNMVNKARKDGHNMAADNLQRWLNGTGGTKIISNKWLRSNREIVSGEDRNIERFQEQLQQLGEVLADGESVNLNDYWDTLVTGGIFGELYYASGTSTLTSSANFKINRKGNSIIISGSITHAWSDTYDWHPGASAYIPGFGNINDSDAKLVEKYCGAKPFEMQGAWKQSFNKSYELGFLGGLNVNLEKK